MPQKVVSASSFASTEEAAQELTLKLQGLGVGAKSN